MAVTLSVQAQLILTNEVSKLEVSVEVRLLLNPANRTA
jgi:hypothetical protein